MASLVFGYIEGSMRTALSWTLFAWVSPDFVLDRDENVVTWSEVFAIDEQFELSRDLDQSKVSKSKCGARL